MVFRVKGIVSEFATEMFIDSYVFSRFQDTVPFGVHRVEEPGSTASMACPRQASSSLNAAR